MSAVLTLVCEKCGRRAPYFRRTDPSLPKWVETLSQSHCDLDGCDTGDRHIETWLDANGVARDPADHSVSDGAPMRQGNPATDEPLLPPQEQSR